MDNTKEFTHLSLCAGYGGIDLGLKRVIDNVRTVAYVEIEAFQCANLVSKMEKGWLDAAPIWSNLKTFPWTSFSGKVDCISGGFPCQPFSAAGKRESDEDPRHLWPFIKRGITIVRPAFVFFENVEGILSSKLSGDLWADKRDTPILLHILRELERLDYTATAGIFSASENGASHRRNRVFILGFDKQKSCEQLQLKKLKPNIYPSGRCDQNEWEPPRFMVNPHNSQCAIHDGDTRKQAKKWKAIVHKYAAFNSLSKECENQYSMARNNDGPTCGMDKPKHHNFNSSPSNQSKSLGNGVVPDTAAKAFEVLYKRILESSSKLNND